MTTLTKRELAAIHQILEAAGGLLTPTSASEMLVTYPSRSRLYKAAATIAAPQEFENDDSGAFERQECGSVDRPSQGSHRRA